MNQFHPLARIGLHNDIKPILEKVCKAFAVGKLKNFSIIESGFEDCNVTIESTQGKFVAKIFAKIRSEEVIQRYKAIMENAIAANVQHPIILTKADGVIYKDTDISCVLMEHITGKTFLDMNRAPTIEELRIVLGEVAKISSITYKPIDLYDAWAVQNIRAMLEQVKQYIQPEDLLLVQHSIAEYEKIPVVSLPHCFVHGDFTKANVMKADNGQIYILDFSVSNWYPRIQELAVIIANLLYNGPNGLSLKERYQIVSDEHNKLIPLTDEEKKYLYPYAITCAAMEFLGSHQEKYIKGNTNAEVDYWLDLGRQGLKQAFKQN
jgi:Ser/Thr protein kinase RdoA (MazF antagonist)